MIDWVSLVLQLFETVIPSLGKVKFIVDDVEMQLDIPREMDAAGGYEHGSFGSFRLEIINKKNQNTIIENPYCVAFRGKTVLQDRIVCYNQLTHKKVAERLKYDSVKTIIIPARESKIINMRFTSNEDLKACNRIVLFCSTGIRQRKITVYEIGG